MKTQISRDGFRPDKRYSGVYQQQGRMITDRDWNEMVDILKSRLDEGMADAVGSGVPRKRGVVLAKGNPGGIAITPGLVYAGGVAARVASVAGTSAPFAYDQQADYPAPPALPTTGGYVLYADVWERPVLALEDDELRDPGLNGADTTTRTRTMAQIKWAPSSLNPEDPAQNPSRGNATLSAGIPAAAGGDPLGAQNPVGGDYLFRLEVHDVWWSGSASQPNRVVLKWSRENGAEQYKALDAPSSFKSGPWIYEVYKQRHEMILGYHSSAASPPARGGLVAGFPFLTAQNDEDSFIRRWDGFCVLNLNGANWGFSPNAPEDPRQTAPGATATIANGALTVRLVDLEFSLGLQGKTFLPGDFWQVPVRRAVHGPGTSIVQAAQPAGIVHRYVKLANVSATGDVTPAVTTFPALTEITAADVRYDGSGSTNGLYTAAHDTVKKALDRLWQLGAEHTAYTKPSNDSLYKDKTVANVRDALNLLSDVRSRQIAYEGRPAFPDVQTAIDELFARSGGEASGFTVGTDGDFPNLSAAIQALQSQGRRDIRLALLPGDHELNLTNPILNAGQPAHLTVTGAGWASRLLVRKPAYFKDFASVTFQGIAMEFDLDALLQAFNCELNLLDNRISGISKIGVIFHQGATRILLRDNVAEIAGADPAAQPAAILTPMDTLETMRTLFLTRSPRLFAIRAQDVLAKVRALPAAERARRADTIQASVTAAGISPFTYNSLLTNIRQTSGPDDNAVALLATIRLEALYQVGIGTFLTLQHTVPPTRLESNQIFGWVRLYGTNDGELTTLSPAAISTKVSSATFDTNAKNDLVVVNNRMSGFRVDAAGTIQAIQFSNPISPLFQRIVATDNTFEAVGNQIAAVNVELNSNLFLAASSGWVIGEETLFLGNVARIDVGIETFTKNVVLAGNSPHVKIRKV